MTTVTRLAGSRPARVALPQAAVTVPAARSTAARPGGGRRLWITDSEIRPELDGQSRPGLDRLESPSHCPERRPMAGRREPKSDPAPLGEHAGQRPDDSDWLQVARSRPTRARFWARPVHDGMRPAGPQRGRRSPAANSGRAGALVCGRVGRGAQRPGRWAAPRARLVRVTGIRVQSGRAGARVGGRDARPPRPSRRLLQARRSCRPGTTVTAFARATRTASGGTAANRPQSGSGPGPYESPSLIRRATNRGPGTGSGGPGQARLDSDRPLPGRPV